MKASRPFAFVLVLGIAGRRTLPEIRRSAEAETGTDIDFTEILKPIDFLRVVGWIL